MRKTIAPLLLALLAGCAMYNQQGMDALNRGDFATAEQRFNEGAQRGDPNSFNNLGVLAQRRGQRDQAIRYYTLAARWGNSLAAQNLIALGASVPPPDLAMARAQVNAAQAQQTAATLQMMRALQPPPGPQPINCNSWRMGNSVQTTCN